MNVLQATEFTGLIVGIGGASAVIYKGGQALRRLSRFIDRMAGSGDDSEPGVLKRLDTMQSHLDDLSAGQVTLTQSQDAMAAKLNAHCDTDAVAWKADGEAWGHRLDDQVTDLGSRVTALEDRQDPVTKL